MVQNAFPRNSGGLIGIVFCVVTLALSLVIGCTSSTTQGFKDNIVSISHSQDKDYIISVITYQKNGENKTVNIKSTGTAKLMDINGDKTREIVVDDKISVGRTMIAPENRLIWQDIYRLDIDKEKLIYVSGDYPQYYEKVYIPEKLKLMETFPANDGGAKIVHNLAIEIAREIINKTYLPNGKVGLEIENRMRRGNASQYPAITSPNPSYSQKPTLAKTRPALRNLESALIGHWLNQKPDGDTHLYFGPNGVIMYTPTKNSTSKYAYRYRINEQNSQMELITYTSYGDSSSTLLQFSLDRLSIDLYVLYNGQYRYANTTWRFIDDKTQP